MKRIWSILLLLAILLISGCAERKDAILGSQGGVLAYLSRTSVRGAAKDITVMGNLAYVADEPYGISIYDISNPASPVLVDSLQLVSAERVRLVSLDPSGRVAVIQAVNSLLIYDLKYDLYLISTGSANHVEVQAQLNGDTLTVFRADKDQLDGFNCEKFLNTSVNDTLSFLFSPIFSSYHRESVYGFALGSSGTAFLSKDLTGYNTVNYGVSGDISVISTLNLPGKVRDAALSGNVLCLAAGYEGLLTVDVSDPANPEPLGSLIIANATDLEWIETDGNRAYLLDDYDGVFAVDLTDPTQPALIGSIYTADPNNFCIAGNLILIADEDMGLVICQILY
ncbi:MAG: hypothetical protein ABH878_09825 [bacterium]